MPHSHDTRRPGSVLMVQGCASSVGKSLIATGLCRLFKRRGLSVAPFKAQNLALNSYVTADGGELGRSQAVQAEACGIQPTVDMNPVLLKPEGESHYQVVLLGRPLSRREATETYARKEELGNLVAGSLARLREQFDLVVIEGAGSPAEINLRERDIVNMHIARAARAPVLLVGDIERGGVFAHFAGTLALLEPEDRAQVAGLVINKFHGDARLLDRGVELIEEHTGLPVMGVIPHVAGLRIAEEDSVALDDRRGQRRGAEHELEIAVVRFPHISNHDDFQPLEHEAGVLVRYVEGAAELEGADLVVLPGTKNTRGDLAWLRANGMDEVLAERARNDQPVLGICGGYQMLGNAIQDPEGIEGPAGAVQGLGLLPISTRFLPGKTTRRVRVRPAPGGPASLAAGAGPIESLAGYEIHMGRVTLDAGARALFAHEPDGEPEGAHAGSVAGTLLHGLFENAGLRRSLLDHLRSMAPMTTMAAGRDGLRIATPNEEYERLADALEDSLDLPAIEALLGEAWPRASPGTELA